MTIKRAEMVFMRDVKSMIAKTEKDAELNRVKLALNREDRSMARNTIDNNLKICQRSGVQHSQTKKLLHQANSGRSYSTRYTLDTREPPK